MKKAYKIEIKPTKEQKIKINKTIGISRYVYNFYLIHNKEIYEKEKRFVSGMEFSKWLNNEYIPNNPDKVWIKEVSSKATKKAIMNADGAFRKFFNGKAKFPKLKKKKKQTVKAYFPKNNKTDWTIERHRVKIPTLGWVRLKEYGYIPLNAKVSSGTVSQQADRYYVSILVEEENSINNSCYSEGIGIDLGLKDFAIFSNKTVYKNINKTARIKNIEKKLIREQRSLSRKYESLKKQKNKKEGEATRQNIQKQVLKVQKIYRRLYNIRTDYINKIVAEIVKTKPEYVTIEDLNVSGMMKNKHLSKAIASQKFSEFRTKLISKCKNNDIEVRLVDRFYPSSKLCNKCRKIKKDLRLSDRIYKCECGYVEDRDLNASFNLRDAKIYRVA